jgi:hypothetical protein
MPLKYSYNKADEIPEGFKDHYTETDGKFLLQADGIIPKARLDEFRDSNIDLKKQLESANTKLGEIDGIDLDHARKLIDQADKQKDRKLLEAGEVDKLVDRRTTALKATYEAQVKDLTTERNTLNETLAKREIDNAVLEAAQKTGVQKTAIEDVLNRARQVFSMQQGRATAQQGGEPIYNSNGDPLTVSEWVSQLAQGAPHLFSQNTGGGATGTGAGGSGSIPNGSNPFDRNSGWNLTEQMTIMKNDPVKAQRMKMAASG